MAHNLARWTARIGLGEQLVGHQDPPTTLLLPRRTAHPLGAPPHFASSPALALGKPVQSRHGSIASNSTPSPDGTAGVNADGDLTHSPDYPTASQTCARLVPERLLLHTTLTISPSIATAGRHHRVCVATSRRPCIPIYWNRACPVRLPLPIIPGAQRHGPSLRWILN